MARSLAFTLVLAHLLLFPIIGVADETLKLVSIASAPAEIHNGGTWNVSAVVRPVNALNAEPRDCWGLIRAPWENSISLIYTDQCLIQTLGDGTYRLTLKTEFPPSSVSYEYRLGFLSLRMKGASTAEYLNLDPEALGEGPSVRVRSDVEADPAIFLGAKIITPSGTDQVRLGDTLLLRIRMNRGFHMREGQILIPVLKDTDLLPGSTAPVWADAVELRPQPGKDWWYASVRELDQPDATELEISLTIPKHYDHAAVIRFDLLKLVSRELRDIEINLSGLMPLEVVKTRR